MKPIEVSLIFLLVLFKFSTSTPSLSNQEIEAEKILEQIEDIVRRTIPILRNDTELNPNVAIRTYLNQFYYILKDYDYQHFTNKDLQRRIKRILKGSYYPPINDHYKDIVRRLKNVPISRWSCSYGERNKCSMAYKPNIKSVFSASQNLDELIYYWQEWRNKTTKEIRPTLEYFINYYKNATNFGASKPSAFWYYNYDDPNFIDELTEVMNMLRPFYIQFHAYVRNALNKQYGDEIVSLKGPIPHHLVEKVELQSWKKDSVLKNPIIDKKLPNLQAELDSHGYTPLKIVEKSAEFFNSLGVKNLTEIFWRRNLHVKSRAGPDCKSDIFDFQEAYMEYCPKSHFKKLLQTHGDMGRVFYAIERNKLPFGSNEEACPGFANAIGEAAILSASSPKHIKTLSLLEDYDYDDETSLNRLFRQAIHTLLTIPEFFVHEKLWIKMIDGIIQPDEYNCEYWNLMEQYAGIQPPVQRTNDVFDFSHKFYEGIAEENGHTRKLMSEFLGYQIYRGLCEKSGEFVRGNAYLPLQNCDFFGKHEAGQFLNEIMAKGSKESWREIMSPLVGTLKVSAAALLEFYDPLHVWLEEENFNNNVHIGWEFTNKCVSSRQNKTS